MSPAQRGLCLLYHLLASTSEQIAQNELRTISSKKNKTKTKTKKQEKNKKKIIRLFITYWKLLFFNFAYDKRD